MTQISTIFRLRRTLAKNRISRISGQQKGLSALAIAVSVGGLLLAGHFAAPTLMEPPIDLATPRGLAPDALPPGAAALEAAFWITALVASVLNFRILELLFRRKDIVTLQTLPIAPGPLFIERLLASLTEAVVTATFLSLFFLPLVWHGGAAAALASYIMLLGGLVFGAIIAMAVMIAATKQMIPDNKTSRRNLLADAYGGAGQILLYAPAGSLGAIVLIALFWKLLVGEPLRLARISEPFLIGSGIVAFVLIYCLIYAYKHFVSHYYSMAPRFHEADAANFSAYIDYQQSSFQDRRRWEFGLTPRAALTYRALSIDDDRRLAGARIGYFVILLLTALGLATIELTALPGWALATFPVILTAVVINPWKRLSTRSALLNHPMAMPVSLTHRTLAASRVALREYTYLAVPYALAIVVIVGYFRDVQMAVLPWVLTALFAGPALAMILSVVQKSKIGESMLRWLPSLLVALMVALAVLSLPALIAVSILLTLVLLVQQFTITDGPHVEA